MKPVKTKAEKRIYMKHYMRRKRKEEKNEKQQATIKRVLQQAERLRRTSSSLPAPHL